MTLNATYAGFSGNMNKNAVFWTLNICCNNNPVDFMISSLLNIPQAAKSPIWKTCWSEPQIGLAHRLVRTTDWSGPQIGLAHRLVWTTCWSGPHASLDHLLKLQVPEGLSSTRPSRTSRNIRPSCSRTFSKAHRCPLLFAFTSALLFQNFVSISRICSRTAGGTIGSIWIITGPPDLRSSITDLFRTASAGLLSAAG